MPYKDPVKQREFQRKRLTIYKKRVQSLKETNPCTDCGQYYPYYVMDFDHVRGIKINEINKMQSHRSGKIDEEIDKCDLVCSNCHRIRTFNRL